MKTLGEIVDAVMNLGLEEQRLLIQLLETRQTIPSLSKSQKPSTEPFEDGRLTSSGIQGIMDELSATLDSSTIL